MATTVLGLKTFAASDPVDYNEVNDNYVKIDNGVKTAMQGRAAYNLLDNSDFRNPVNQRGIQSGASITEYAYCLDRWMNFGTTAGTLTLSENGISFTMTNFNQRLPETIKTGTVVTAAAKWNDGTVVTVTGAITRGNAWTWFTAANNGHQIGVIDMGNNKEAHFTILGGSGVVEWAALYEGSYTADTLPAYVPKGYAAELAECQRYFWRCSNTWFAEGSGYAVSNTEYRVSIILPQMMRVTPTMISSTGNTTSYGIKIHTASGANLTPTAVSLLMENNRIALTLTGTFTNGELGVLRLENDYLDFSADL